MLFIVTHCRIVPDAVNSLTPVAEYVVEAESETEARVRLLSEYDGFVPGEEVLVTRREGTPPPRTPVVFRRAA